MRSKIRHLFICVSHFLSVYIVCCSFIGLVAVLLNCRRHSCHKGNGYDNLSTNHGKRWHVEDWRELTKASKLLPIMSTTGKSSESLAAEWRAKEDLTWKMSHRAPWNWMGGWGRQCLFVLSWLWFGADFCLILGVLLVVFPMKGFCTWMSFLLPWVVPTGLQDTFPRGCFEKEVRIVKFDLILLIISEVDRII